MEEVPIGSHPPWDRKVGERKECPKRETGALAMGTTEMSAMRRLERSWAQLSEQELHYASLLPIPGSERPDPGHREGTKEDPSTEYACIAKN
ncbi:leukocyte-specific transcript 1 protein isoform X2 [Lontra canadensis]|uniref:leukocyte-specific transcript 1 protein isoform X2 n=1 Tax=Lontra canadensis TaxID=76717 RepID=UPI0013F318A9|nr:leukocyte-specific transcript 1 protein isoform X2 [Lontra canadensis]XP_032703048.1 leukocyte-specific transcript 1 protein isoform X2 [Lontra canadensis]